MPARPRPRPSPLRRFLPPASCCARRRCSPPSRSMRRRDSGTWFDAEAAGAIPDHDGTLATARGSRPRLSRATPRPTTRGAPTAPGCAPGAAGATRHALPCLPARAADVVAFLAAERGRGLSVTTVELRRAAIRYLHFLAGCPVPTAEAQVAETVAGMRRHAADRGELPAKKLAATVAVLREILAQIRDDLRGPARPRAAAAGLRRRAAPRRAGRDPGRAPGAARARAAPHPAPLQGRARRPRASPSPSRYGTTELCPVRALRRWQDGGRDHRRRAVPPHLDARPRRGGSPARPAVGTAAIDPGTVARIVKKRAAAAGFDRDRSAATASSAARSPPAWTAASTPPGSSSSAATRATPCSTNT